MTENRERRVHTNDEEILSLAVGEDGMLLVETFAGTEVGFERASEADYSVFMRRSGDVYTFDTRTFQVAAEAFQKAIKSPQAFRMACDCQ